MAPMSARIGGMAKRKTSFLEVVGTVVKCRSVDADLSAGARHALIVLASYYPNIYPPLDRLVIEVGASRRSVIRWIGELESAGLITRKRGRRHYNTHYFLHPSLIQAPRKAHEPPQEPESDPLADLF